MNKLKIGLIGLTFLSGNKGCEALMFSFFEIIKIIGKENIEFYDIERIGIKNLLTLKVIKEENEYREQIKAFDIPLKFIYYRKVNDKILFFRNIKKLDVCFDFTQGDSFTDIYGDERFAIWTDIKEAVISQKVPLVLGNQTIGPFYKENNKRRAVELINKCSAIYTRDIDSYNYVKSISNVTPILTTDVAFFLPYQNTGYKKSNKIGFNPSGLLWNGGYTKNNQFGLSLDYKQYCRRCISYAIENNFEIHLIGHVISEDNVIDNDYIAIRELHKEFPNTILAPNFKTPMEAKTYISNMVAFTGARMHATIASISSGVPVLAFSYSRKFEGLFKSLNYDHIIHGNKDDLEVAVKKFKKFIDNIDNVRKDVLNSQDIISKMKQDMLKEYANIFYVLRK